jgi:probable F420-dependent oxidoreductase
MKVRIGFGLGTQGLTDLDTYGALLDDLERLRFDSLWLPERVAGSAIDPVVGLAIAAGRTKRLKLGPGILVLPGRSPAILAKQLATLDRLSNGRLLLAFGVGTEDAAEEQVIGVPLRKRGPWMEEVVPLLRRLWAEDGVDHTGKLFQFEGLTIRPRPAQPRMDIWLAGKGPLALRRIGRLADGWLASALTPAEIAVHRATIDDAAREAGRTVDPEHFGMNITYAREGLSERAVRALQARRPDVDPSLLVAIGPAALREQVQRYVDVGTSKFVVRFAEEPTDWATELALLADVARPLEN